MGKWYVGDKRCSHKKPKKVPYGAIRTAVWCDNCDAQLVTPKPNKTRERRKNKVSPKDVE